MADQRCSVVICHDPYGSTAGIGTAQNGVFYGIIVWSDWDKGVVPIKVISS
jgi:hypothetical protein